MQRLLKSLYLGTLAFAVFLEAAVLYFVENPGQRLALGMALLLPIVWMIARTRVVEAISKLPIVIRRRQYSEMRKHVVLFMDEVKRLNWMAVDADRGFRSQDEATNEMDAIEKRLLGLVSEIRATAGREVIAERQALVSETSQAPTETESGATDEEAPGSGDDGSGSDHGAPGGP